MEELKEVKQEVHNLGKQIAGIHPLVNEVHGQMPRVAEALEILASVMAKLENNTEEHKRIHYRITSGEEVSKRLEERHNTLENRFNDLRDEHVVCITTKQIERRVVRGSMWTKLKAKAAEKIIELVTLAVVAFAAWMVISHLQTYPQTAPIFHNQTTKKG